MKALTLYQPWATAMAIGLKTIETRDWSTKYRGPVIIHSAQKATREMDHDFTARLHASREDRAVFALAGYHFFADLPFGQSLAVAELIDCVPVEQVQVRYPVLFEGWSESRWGDYSAGRYAWIFNNLRRFERPRHVSGSQGLWEWKYGSPEVTTTDRLAILPDYRLPPQIQRPPFATA